MNELTEQTISTHLTQIKTIGSLDEILQYLKTLNGLKVALECVNTFYEQSVKYAMLHVQALMKVIELGGASELHGFARKTAEWLTELSEDERNRYIALCSDGQTIINVWKEHVHLPEKEQYNLEYAEYLRDSIVDKIKENGMVDISFYSDQIRKRVPSKTANDIIDGMRKNLRNAGAVGVGNNSNTYVMPKDVNYADQVVEACKERYKSIFNDIRALINLVRESNVSFEWSNCLSEYNLSHYNYSKEELQILLALNDLGCFHSDTLLDERMKWGYDNNSCKYIHNGYVNVPDNPREFYLWLARESRPDVDKGAEE